MNNMFDLLHSVHALEARLETELGTVGLSLAKFGVLTAMARATTPLTLGDLAGHLSCVRSNITQLMDRLETDGLVKRSDDPEDRRSIRAVLTPSGRELQAKGQRLMARLGAEFSAGLSEQDRTAIARMAESLK